VDINFLEVSLYEKVPDAFESDFKLIKELQRGFFLSRARGGNGRELSDQVVAPLRPFKTEKR
jgi:hypothetical protein